MVVAFSRIVFMDYKRMLLLHLTVQLQCSYFFISCKCEYCSSLLYALLSFSVISVSLYPFLFPFNFDILGRCLDFYNFK